jgi:hypothetical protein
MIRNQATPEGRWLGQELARLRDEAEPRVRRLYPWLNRCIKERCATCPFRAGDHIPNVSPVTLMDALKCVLERTPFDCHEDRLGRPCSGWSILMRSGAPPKPRPAPKVDPPARTWADPSLFL